jgi:putative ABC transport system substrate-binding protein
MVAVVEPAAAGLVASLARPGGNLTGLAFDVSPEIVRKLLELLKEAVPRVSRAVVLWNPANPGDRPYVTELQAAAAALRVPLAIVEVRTPEGLDRAFTAILEHRPDALVVLSDPLLNVHRKPIVAFAAKNRIPTAYRLRDAVDDGGLMSYAVNLTELNRRAASYVDRILKGAKPGDLPVEQPTKFELVINLKTAKALGLTIPPSLLVRADQVIE